MDLVTEMLTLIGEVSRGVVTPEDARARVMALFQKEVRIHSARDCQEIVDEFIIKERKERYGNNFPCIANLWITYLSRRLGKEVHITDEDVAIMMALMKVSRLAQSPTNEDSIVDLINYMWIGLNYEKYLRED